MMSVLGGLYTYKIPKCTIPRELVELEVAGPSANYDHPDRALPPG